MSLANLKNIKVPENIAPQFFLLVSQNKILEALRLLPPEIQRLIFGNNNSTTHTIGPNVTLNATARTFTQISIVGGLDALETSRILAKLYAYIILVTSIIGILGNSVVIGTYIRQLKSLSIYRKLVLHLASCDFVFSILQTILISPSLHNSRWNYGEGACKFTRGTILLGSLVAVGTILVIALDRFEGTVSIKSFTRSNRRIVTRLSFVWVLALLSIIPTLVALTVSPISHTCVEDWRKAVVTRVFEKLYSLFLLIAWFIVPCCLIALYYSRMINMLRVPFEKRGFGSLQMDPKYVAKRHRGDKRVIKILFAVVVAFFVCCLPIRLTSVVWDFVDTTKLTQTEFFTLTYFGLLPYPFHVCLNPVIYCLIDRQFRKDVWQWLRCRKLIKRLPGRSTMRTMPSSSSIIANFVQGVRGTMFSKSYSFDQNDEKLSKSDSSASPRRISVFASGIDNDVFVVTESK